MVVSHVANKKKARRSFQSSLAAADITIEGLKLFYALVVKKRETPPGFFRYWFVTEPTIGWKAMRKNGKDLPLNKYAVVAHLAGERWISKEAPDFTDFFVLDLDVKQTKDVRSRYDVLQKIFDMSLFPIRSWDRGGVHLYGFLKRPTLASVVGEQLREVLEANGVVLKKGFIETFPGMIHHLRLPFGSGSYPLDRQTLEPMIMKVSDRLRLLDNFKRRHKIDLDSLAIGWQLKTQEKQKREERLRKFADDLDRGKFDFDAEVDRDEKLPTVRLTARQLRSVGKYDTASKRMVVNEPIPTYGTRNDRLMKAIQELMVYERLSSEETKQVLHNWLHNDKLGHKSNDLEMDPKSVHHQIDLAVDNFEKKMYHGGGIPHDKLSLIDIKSIVERTELLREDGRFGRKAFNMQLFLFHLIGQFKGSRSKFRFIPHGVLERLDGASRNTVTRMIYYCLNRDLIRLVSPEFPSAHRCRSYTLQFDFQEGPEIGDLIEGLRTIYSKSELFNMYTRRIYSRIFS